MLIFAVVWSRVQNRARVRNVVDPLKLKMPVFGTLSRRSLSRFTQPRHDDPRRGPHFCRHGHRRRHPPETFSQAVHDVELSVRQGGVAGGALVNHLSFHPWWCR